MPMPVRHRLAGRYGQATLDPSRPLYVRRRISRGAAGALAPGEVFDAAATAPHRLRMLYRGGYISHEPPDVKPVSPVARAVEAALARAAQVASTALDAPPPVPAPLLEQPPTGKPKRARAGA